MEKKETPEPIKAWIWDHQEMNNTSKPVNQWNSWEAIKPEIDIKAQETKEEAHVEIGGQAEADPQDESNRTSQASKSKWNPKNWF